ncbi:MAG: hypothetical protein ACK445_00555 [Bacteroidota bacterium]|jgi:hypothetical protein
MKTKTSSLIKPILLGLIIHFSMMLSAQSSADLEKINVNDSVHIETTAGAHYFGILTVKDDSAIALLTARRADTLFLKVQQLHAIETINSILPEQVSEDEDSWENSKRRRDSIESLKKIEPLKTGTKVGQVLGGTGGLIAGAVTGFVGGALIGLSISGDAADFGAFLLGAGIGSIAGGTMLSSYLIYSIGNTPTVKGKYWQTYTGVVIGCAVSMIFPPLLLVAPSMIGVGYYNKSRYKVPNNMKAPQTKKRSTW